MKEFGPKCRYYDKWKVIYIIGDLFLDEKYKLIDNVMYIKCEDSYLHLFKKLALSLKYLKECFNIKEGVLRCNDDLIFNENNLINFLRSNKYDYHGQRSGINGLIKNSKNIEQLKKKENCYDSFILNYYKNYKNDLSDPKHGINLTIDELKTYLVRPQVVYAFGSIFYISLKCCNMIIDTMEKINYNIFYFDEFCGAYPYLIEDIAVGYVMCLNKIDFYDSNKFFYDSNIFIDNIDKIAIHTNKYK